MENIISSPFKSERAIQLPFAISASGSISDATDYSKIWDYRVRQAIGTSRGERLLYSDYGMRIPELTFATMSLAKEIVTKEIQSVFMTYLPELSLDSVNVLFDEDNGIVNVAVTYVLPNNNLGNTVLGVAVVSGDNPISEV
jgi:phage baseplate assembly protein W